ncbi:MAG: UDP-N-acetylglucosamine--LPS N-acetylglucosamine transferase [Luteococcus sp.]|uniref:PssD/Cps14F family polysaccharide biosynthesis glycosyltransferase n=1 Tax=Luteococcus sp. TaxID=1969402 RepID=UPI0026472B5A|nr:PssD/Cps14F family polysaccharide biosynthesis glycosyltransferase [Luteococcus sp.]MDN5563760.1 UDP-N-acetylglucosamine--LPS N-acetylglucosamine transferase [Luteococcus sp.]
MTEPSDDKDLLLIASSGGHLAQLMNLEPWWRGYRRQWVTFDLPDTRARLAGEDVVPAYHPTTRNAKNLVRNTGLAIRMLQRRRPDAIISTGAAVAVPFFLMGKLLGIPRIYIEVYDRFDTPTLTGRICSHLSSVFCVQLEDQLRMYPKATVIGPLL